MITTEGVFRDDHLPRRLEHREPEVAALSRALEPALDGGRAADVLVAGPSGVGKTALCRHTLAKAERHAALDHVHVRSLGETTGSILRTILEGVRGQGVATTRPVDELPGAIGAEIEAPLVVILDEGDDLPTSDVYDHLLEVRGLSTITICHDPDLWLAHAAGAARESVDRELRLERYGVDELADILAARAERGLLPNKVEREQLEAIADHVAGVAREGIQALRAAAELASERDHRSIEDVDVEDSFERARRRIRVSNLASMPLHHQVLYAIVQEASGGELPGSELHDRYDRVAPDVYYGTPQQAIGERARRNKLAKLRDYGLLEARGEHRHRVYRPTDPALEAPIAIDDSLGSETRL